MFMQLADAEPSKSTNIRIIQIERWTNEELEPARGIATAVVLAIPIWAVIAVLLYMVL